MRRLLMAAVAAGLIANALAMLFAPEAWYALMPGVSATGPFNAHFVRDIGCAYGVAGAGLAWAWRRPDAWPAAMAGAWFLSGHALVHLWDAAAGRASAAHLIADLPAVVMVPVLALLLSRPAASEPPSPQRAAY